MAMTPEQTSFLNDLAVDQGNLAKTEAALIAMDIAMSTPLGLRIRRLRDPQAQPKINIGLVETAAQSLTAAPSVNVAEYEDKIADLSEQIDRLNSNLNDEQTRSADLTRQVQELTRQIESLNAAESVTSAPVESDDGTILALRAEIDALKTAENSVIESLRAEIDALKTARASVSEPVETNIEAREPAESAGSNEPVSRRTACSLKRVVIDGVATEVKSWRKAYLQVAAAVIATGRTSEFPKSWFPREPNRYTQDVNGVNVFDNMNVAMIRARTARITETLGITATYEE
jgi:TolA-binding protein